tara:strand:- start:196 stop:1656 length:1461 start_codon:yes stop_codon:yes gene_type:complete
MELNLIVAIDTKNGIGRMNKIPWLLKDDLNHFKMITTNNNNKQILNTENQKNVVVMGRNTWESLPSKVRPLKDRFNIVLSSKNKFIDSDKVDFITNSFKNVLHFLEKENDYFDNSKIFIIGGEVLYNDILNNYSDLITYLYITEIYANYSCDRFFPKINEEIFKISKISDFKNENNINYRYLIYSNINKIKNLYINNEEKQYKNLVNNILNNGIEKIDRTKVGILSLFGSEILRYDISKTIPLLTLKKSFIRAIFEELMLYIRGETDNKILNDKNIHIWDGNTTREFLDERNLKHLPEGDMGETYGFNMRNYGGNYINCKTKHSDGFDQLKYVLDLIKNDPTSRRILINLWNPKTLHNCALPSCLMQYQFYVDTKKKQLNLQIYLRSSDVFLANNWNTITGTLFVYLICNLNDINLTPGFISVVCGDAHIYKNHIELSKKMIERESYPYPKLFIKNKKNNIEDFCYEDLQIIGYKSHESMKTTMAI